MWMIDMALKNIAIVLQDRWIKVFMDFLGTLLGNVTTAAIEKGDKQVGSLANCLSAMLATFRFQHHGKRKFNYIRFKIVSPQLLSAIKNTMVNTEGSTYNDRAAEISQWLQELIANHLNVALADMGKSDLVAKFKDRMLSSIPTTLPGSVGGSPDGGGLNPLMSPGGLDSMRAKAMETFGEQKVSIYKEIESF